MAPAGVIAPMRFPVRSVNHMFPSGPAVIQNGAEPSVRERVLAERTVRERPDGVRAPLGEPDRAVGGDRDALGKAHRGRYGGFRDVARRGACRGSDEPETEQGEQADDGGSGTSVGPSHAGGIGMPRYTSEHRPKVPFRAVVRRGD